MCVCVCVIFFGGVGVEGTHTLGITEGHHIDIETKILHQPLVMQEIRQINHKLTTFVNRFMSTKF